MSHHELIRFFVAIGILLAVALLAGQLMRRLGQPRVLGELIGGILLGPTLVGGLYPDFLHIVAPTNEKIAGALASVLQLGMLFFLFVAGLEVDLGRVRRQGRAVALTSVTGILVPFLLGAASVRLLPDVWGEGRQDLTFTLFIGAALSISALPVIARIFMDLGLSDKPIGSLVLSAAIIDDLTGWTLFTIVLSRFVPDAAPRPLGLTVMYLLLFAGTVIVGGRLLGRRAVTWLRRHVAWPSGFIGVTAILILAGAALAELIGVHAIFGAFLIGVSLGQAAGREDEAHAVIYQFAVSFFAPLYFVSIGLRANFAVAFDWPLVILVLVVATVGKVAGAGLGAWLGGLPRRESLAIGVGMNARGAIEMILATVALDYGVIDERLFVALVIMALVTSLMSAPLLQRLLLPQERAARAVV